MNEMEKIVANIKIIYLSSLKREEAEDFNQEIELYKLLINKRMDELEIQEEYRPAFFKKSLNGLVVNYFNKTKDSSSVSKATRNTYAKIYEAEKELQAKIGRVPSIHLIEMFLGLKYPSQDFSAVQIKRALQAKLALSFTAKLNSKLKDDTETTLEDMIADESSVNEAEENELKLQLKEAFIESFNKLSGKEKECAFMVLQGKKTKDIAEILKISEPFTRKMIRDIKSFLKTEDKLKELYKEIA